MIMTSVMKELRYIKMIAWFLFPNILTQGHLFKLFRRNCSARSNICKKLRRFVRIFFESLV